MIGNDILAILDATAATNSRTEKEAIITRHKDDSLLRKVLFYAYNQGAAYHIKKLPEVAKHGTKSISLESPVWTVLDMLDARELTGNKALKQVEDWLGLLDQANAELLSRIILKDLRAGFGRTLINAVIPGLTPNFDVMLAHKFEVKRIKSYPVRADIKIDGWRTLAFVDPIKGTCDFYSRTGKLYTTLEHLKAPMVAAAKNFALAVAMPADLQTAVGTLLDDPTGTCPGCLVIEGEVEAESFKNTSSKLRRKNQQATDAVFLAFDIQPMWLFNGEELSVPATGGYDIRRRLLAEFVKGVPTGGKITLIPSYLCGNEEEIYRVYEAARANNREGIIVKPLDGLYERKRSHAWLKMKAEETADLRVTGAFEGAGKYAGSLGGLLCDFNGVEVRVGGGFSDAQRAEFWLVWLRDKETLDSFSEAPTDLVGRIAEVEYHEVTPDGSLRHPRFVRFRDDKTVGDKPEMKEAA